MSSPDQVRWPTYAGLFGTTLATLMYEILLTRIFSVTMWYHFAFMVVSVTLFGLTVGAILVFVFPGSFGAEVVKQRLAQCALLFALTIALSFLIHRLLPFNASVTLGGYLSLLSIFVLFAIPFVFSGIVVTLALTKFPQHISRLYAADLVGAAAGSILLIVVLQFTDGPTAVMVVGLLASVSAVLFAVEADGRGVLRAGVALSLLLGVFAIGNSLMAREQASMIRLLWVKGTYEQPALYERWNSFSRIRVFGDPSEPESPESRGIDPSLAGQYAVRQLHLDIDANAATVLTGFDGDLAAVEYLKYDVTNLAHHLRPSAWVLVVGAGGGRDVLSALVFEQEQVVGVELNQDILRAVNGRFGAFTGHLDRYPSVSFVRDEARSYLERSTEEFGIIQVSLTDTWAATAAGAFVLSENALYTTEAWRTFLQRLTPDGVLSVSRWYDPVLPGEIYRLTALTAAALVEQGADDPREHIVIVRSRHDPSQLPPNGVGTLLVSRKPFSDEDLDRIAAVSGLANFEVVLSPRRSSDAVLANIAAGTDLPTVSAGLPISIEPPTDDSPFFFNMVSLGAVFDPQIWNQGISSLNLIAVFILVGLLITVTLLSALCILLPLILATRRRQGAVNLSRSTPHFLFFAAIGFGFILVEISQMQRLIIFLGHPTYGLSVVLFALLLFSGLGSYLTRNVPAAQLRRPGGRRLGLLLVVLVLFGALTADAIGAFRGATTPVRILVALVMLAPLGLLMGMAFPLGMKGIARRLEPIKPWLWGINGAASVSGSVLAVAIALSSGISAAFWAGTGCYVVAFAAFLWVTRAGHGSGVPATQRLANRAP